MSIVQHSRCSVGICRFQDVLFSLVDISVLFLSASSGLLLFLLFHSALYFPVSCDKFCYPATETHMVIVLISSVCAVGHPSQIQLAYWYYYSSRWLSSLQHYSVIWMRMNDPRTRWRLVVFHSAQAGFLSGLQPVFFLHFRHEVGTCKLCFIWIRS